MGPHERQKPTFLIPLNFLRGNYRQLTDIPGWDESDFSGDIIHYMEWYQIDIRETYHKLASSDGGLTSEEVQKRLREHGPNRLGEAEGIGKLKILLHQFTSPLIYILIVAAIVTALLQEYIDMGVIIAVVVLNAIVGFIQEFKAEQSVRALKKLVVPKARVLREGREHEINSEDLVPGDIVLLTSGTKVPADMRLVRAVELRTDEAMLTGESLPVEKQTASIRAEHLSPGDQKNIAFMGTAVLNGRAHGIVVATGGKTVLGQIARSVEEVSAAKAPIQIKILKFAKFIGYLTLFGSTAIFALGFMIGTSLSEMFKTAVAAAVATVPEGLPIVVTITMAIGISRMARRNAIIRSLPAVETLGSTTVICSDKTGTLTKNEMTVRLIYDGDKTYEVTGSGYEPKGEILHETIPVKKGELKDLLHLLRVGLLCNESNVYEEDGQYKVDGDPTEGALIVSAIKAGLNQEEEMEQYPEIAMIPFESERGYMATLHRHRGKKIIFVKGAPEKVLDMCTECMGDDNARMKTLVHVSNEFARDGLRVIAMGFKDVPYNQEDLTHEDIKEGIIFAGIQGMMDPPRMETQPAVEACREAGIRTIMITGDHAVTALSVAKQLGIGGDEPRVIRGKELETMSDGDLFKRVRDVSVFARVSPQHKLRITQQLQKHDEIVAVTGDGVNDAPALKAAHVGISMGRTGTDVARESSDMVVADDNFASIFNAIEEGRVVFDNIRKVVLFLIPTGFAAILSILGAMMLGIPIPYVPAQLLWINLVTNGLQDVALGFEPGEKDIIKRPPRNPGEGIMSRLMYERSIVVALVISTGILYNFIYALNSGVSLEEARTLSMTTMVFFQFFQAWNSRSEYRSIFMIHPFSNPFFFIALLAAFFAQLAVLYVPAFQWIFRTTPLSLDGWIHVALVTSTVILVVEIDKAIRRRSLSVVRSP
jgi:Ca2+-transporting ATPase